MSKPTVLALIVATLACGSGLPTQPEVGVLYFRDTGAVVHEYAVTEAEYNAYSDDSGHWITFYVRADDKISPAASDNQQPWLEINQWFSSSQDAVLSKGAVFSPGSYDDSHGNLTNFYHWEHVPLEEARVEIIDSSDDCWLVQISGTTYDGPVIVKASLCHNPERERSFT